MNDIVEVHFNFYLINDILIIKFLATAYIVTCSILRSELNLKTPNKFT